jgi:hypothetical protein
MPVAAARGGREEDRAQPSGPGQSLTSGVPSMNALTIASELLGNLELSSGQLAQLRALNRKYAQRVYTLLHPSDAPTRLALTEAEAADLHAKLTADILAMLTPEQQNLSS